jgi:hypothetical protein
MPLGNGNYVFFTLGVGEIWFTRLAEDGSWAPAVHEQNPQLPGDAGAQAVSTRDTTELQHLAIAVHGGELFHSLWNDQGQATPFGDVQNTAAGRVGPFIDVDAAHGPSGELFVVGCTNDGKLWDTTRNPAGTWRPFEDMQSVPNQTPIGYVRNVSCAAEPIVGIGAAFHVVVLTDTYHLFYTRLDLTTGTFSPFLDIETTTAGEAGNFTDVSCAWDGSCLHVCAVTGGTIQHTMMMPGLTWTPFADVKMLAGAPDPGLIEKVACGSARRLGPPGPVSTGCLLAAPLLLARPFMRRRRTDPLAAAATTMALEVVVVTSAQGAWHTERGPGTTGSWAPFVDVETTAAGPLGIGGTKPRNVAL